MKEINILEQIKNFARNRNTFVPIEIINTKEQIKAKMEKLGIEFY